MQNRSIIECVDRTLKDIRQVRVNPFGGIMSVICGDFRQTLPIIRRASRSTIINAAVSQFSTMAQDETVHIDQEHASQSARWRRRRRFCSVPSIHRRRNVLECTTISEKTSSSFATTLSQNRRHTTSFIAEIYGNIERSRQRC